MEIVQRPKKRQNSTVPAANFMVESGTLKDTGELGSPRLWLGLFDHRINRINKAV